MGMQLRDFRKMLNSLKGGDSVLEVILEVEDGRVSGAGVRDAHTQQPPECGERSVPADGGQDVGTR